MKPSEIFEGENSGLRKVFDEAVGREQSPIEKVLAEFDEMFPKIMISINESQMGFRDERVDIVDSGRVMKDFISESIAQAIAEERERYTEDINFLKKLHSMELDALSLKRLEDFMEWADNRRHTPISP